MGKLVIRLVWDQETAGSSPATLTTRKPDEVVNVSVYWATEHGLDVQMLCKHKVLGSSPN